MDGTIDAVVRAGRAAWPSIALEASALAAHFTDHAVPCDDATLANAADLYLACACARGIPEATRVLDAVLTRDVAGAVARVDARRPFVDEVLQTLRVRLLVGDAPKIASYSGRSALRRWLGTAALRTALNVRRDQHGGRTQEITSTLGARVARGPELTLARERYRGAFEEGLRRALGGLTDRERALLRMNLVERMGIDRLARVYGCGRSTVARWLATAREKLLADLQAHLHAELALGSRDIESLAADVRSGLDVSIARLLEA